MKILRAIPGRTNTAFILIVFFIVGRMSLVLAQDKDAEYKIVKKLFNKEKYDEAIPQLEVLIEKYPDLAGLNFKLGYAYYHTHNQRYKSIALFEKAKSNLDTLGVNSYILDYAPYYTFIFAGDVYYQLEKFNYAYGNYSSATRIFNGKERKLVETKQQDVLKTKNLIKDIFPYHVERLQILNQEFFSERSPIVFSKDTINIDINTVDFVFQSDYNSTFFGENNTNWEYTYYHNSNGILSVESHKEFIPVTKLDGHNIVLKKKNKKGYYDLYKGLSQDHALTNVLPYEMINRKNSNETGIFVVDENNILFVSDRSGGEGGYDIWKVSKRKGKWKKPNNFGKVLNTKYNENFISVFKDKFYFSSDRPGGYGQYDLYESYFDGTMPSYPSRLNYPANSSGNDVDPRKISDNLFLFSSDRGAKDYDIFMIDYSVPVKEFKIIGEIPKEFLNNSSDMYEDAIRFTDLFNQIKSSDIETAVTKVDEMEINQAIEIISDLELEQAVDIMENINRDKAIEVLEGMEVEKAVDIVDAMSISSAIDVISSANDITSIGIVQEMESEKAASLLNEIDVRKTSKILAGMEVEKAVDVVDKFVEEKTIDVIDEMDSESASNIVDHFSDEKATRIIEGVEVEKAVGVLSGMDDDKAKRIVDIFKDEMEEGSENDKLIAIIKSYFKDQVKIKESVIFKTVYFDFNSSELLFLTKKELMVLIDFMNENKLMKIEVVGHTDNIGDWDINLQFSHDRSNEVFKFLRRNKIEKERIIFYGKGPAQPIAPNDSAEGRQLNRRVEVILLQ